MMRSESPVTQQDADDNDFLDTVCAALRQHPRSIPPKFFYDAQGSQLFDLICTTPEYYPTRTETGILQRHGAQMVELIGKDCVLIELGSGSATKTPLLLQHLDSAAEYVPIDICEPHLLQSTARLQTMYPEVRMHPLCADYTRMPALPESVEGRGRHVVFFPGSTIGNCNPDEAVALLRHVATLVGEDGGLLLGVDCKKSPAILNAAYNDAAGHTAAFNINLLERMQRELGAELDVEQFEHYAYYNAGLGRIEMHLISRCAQNITIGDETFHFEAGESLHTENSYKYNAQEFQRLARAAGWHLKTTWRDADGYFEVHYLSRRATEPHHLPQRS
ncbi:MAG: L-histidine N(alpha)-methyltransferase [Gallionella sp.]|nr:L-histidine N(alpha)-methyltransferase [Gallionella sp.]